MRAVKRKDAKCVVIRFGKEPEIRDVVNDIHVWYDIINTDMVQMLHGSMNGHRVVIICDEDGKLKKNVKNQLTGFITKGAKPVSDMVGTLIVAGELDENGKITSLPESLIKRFPVQRLDYADGKITYVLSLEA